MKEIPVEDYKPLSIEILKDFTDFCDANNLKYVLFFGSLLGAIRHGGFIPWDDDVDIAMPREDYEVAIKKYGNNNYGIMNPHDNSSYPYWFAKAYKKGTLKVEPTKTKKDFSIGFHIDVFPFDYCDSEKSFDSMKKKRKNTLFKYRCAMAVLSKNKSCKNFLKKIALAIYNKKYNKYAKKLDLIAQCNNNDDHIFYCYNEIYIDTSHPIYPITIFSNRVKRKFENMEFYVPAEYDVCLKRCYGDYMKLPPKEKQITHHSFKAYYLEENE